MIFVLISFIINSSLAIFYTVWLVPMMIVNLFSWEQNDSSRVWEVRFFCGAAKPTWWHWDYFGREFCFVNKLPHSWFCNSFVELRMQITNLIICTNKFTFHYVNGVYWVTIPIYMCIHLSNDVLFGECISRKKNLRSFFISKLMKFSFKYWNSRGLEWWYRSDEAGHYMGYKPTIQIWRWSND